MTHKQQAIELLNEMQALLDDVSGGLLSYERRRFRELIVDIRTAVTLMEPVENPAKLPATMPRVPLPRGPIEVEEPVLECSTCRWSDGSPVRAGDVDGHMECQACGDRNNLRVRR